jgi:predicted dinucleotide-binding enzyme
VPWSAAESVVCEHAEEMAGKIVIDATDPLASDLTLAVGHDTSGAEMLQSHARKAKFYKAFNSVGVEAMAKPRFPQGTAAMFVAGPDGPDKDIVLRLVADIGFEPVDAGELNIARLLEPLAMLWIQLALNKGHGRDFAFMLARRDVANRKTEERVRVAYAEPEVE